jgi:hypothetical protein
MKHARPGLSFVEVMAAVLIMAVAATTLLGLQGVLVRGVFSAHSVIERLGFIQSYVVIAQKDRLYEKTGPQTKVIEYPALTMVYQEKSLTAKSLTKHTHLVVDQVDAEWPSPYRSRRDTFALIKFRPRKKAGP